MYGNCVSNIGMCIYVYLAVWINICIGFCVMSIQLSMSYMAMAMWRSVFVAREST